jgi:uncharacterized protein (TIGR03435 family)
MVLAPELEPSRHTPSVNTITLSSTAVRSKRALRTKALIAGLTLALLTATVIVKWLFFPGVKEDYFALNIRNLQQVPSGLVVVRPTRIGWSHFNGAISTTVPIFGKPALRLMGRNVSLKQLIATAYGQNIERVALQADAPNTNFDFLITVRTNPHERLQQAIRKKLGFIANMESVDTDVLALKVENSDLPGLTVSGADKKQSVALKDGNRCFIHMQAGPFASGFEQTLGMPVVDKTGLTNFYDSCITWGPQVRQQLHDRPTSRVAVDKILDALGLALTPGVAPLEMLVVKRTN